MWNIHRKWYSEINDAFFFSLSEVSIVQIMTIEKDKKKKTYQKGKAIVDI